MSPEDLNNTRRLSHRESIAHVAHDALPPPVHFESLRITDAQLKNCTNKKVRKFYEVGFLFFFSLHSLFFFKKKIKLTLT